jgi:hypothetical protein
LDFNQASITDDMALVGMWPLTCYGLEKGVYPPVNMLSGDKAPDEDRLEYYAAMRDGSMGVYVRVLVYCVLLIHTYMYIFR